MGTVAPVVSEIFEKTGAYVNTMFWKNYFFFSKFDKILNINNKQTFRCYGNTESGPVFCTDKFLTLRKPVIFFSSSYQVRIKFDHMQSHVNFFFLSQPKISDMGVGR